VLAAVAELALEPVAVCGALAALAAVAELALEPVAVLS
jgi:hypothetical protein